MNRSHTWAAGLAHPVPLLAAALLGINDHVLKPAAWPSSWVAGKLSDLAGLFVFPILVTALGRGAERLLARRAGSPGAGAGLRPPGTGAGPRPPAGAMLPALAILATGALFTGLKLSPGFNRALAPLLGQSALDASDLLALPALAGSWCWMRRVRPAGTAPIGWGAAGALALAALACAATQPPVYSRQYPLWSIQPAAASAGELGCARGQAWVAKSGKRGVGVVVELMGASAAGCRVALRGAHLELQGGHSVPSAAPQPPAAAWTLAPCQIERFYLPFLFDNNAAWNRGVRHGRFVLDLVVEGAPRSWRLVANQAGGGRGRRGAVYSNPYPGPTSEVPLCPTAKIKATAR